MQLRVMFIILGNALKLGTLLKVDIEFHKPFKFRKDANVMVHYQNSNDRLRLNMEKHVLEIF